MEPADKGMWAAFAKVARTWGETARFIVIVAVYGIFVLAAIWLAIR